MSDQPGQAVKTPQGFFASAVSGTGDPDADDGFGAAAAQVRRRRPTERPAARPAPEPPAGRVDEDSQQSAASPEEGATAPAGSPDLPGPGDPGPAADQTAPAPRPRSDSASARSTDPAQPDVSAAGPASDPQQSQVPPVRRRRREDRGTAASDVVAQVDRAPRTRPEGGNVPVVLQLSSELAARAKAHCRDHKITHADLVFLAVDASSERLASRVPQTPSGPSVFTPQRPTREHSETSLTQFPAQMRVHNVEVLDHLAERYGIGSRSALVRDCITAYLDRVGTGSS